MGKDLAAAIRTSETAFEVHNPPAHERETGFEANELSDADTHLRKACRSLRLAEELLAGDRDALMAERYFHAAIELAFACIERTSSAGLIATRRIGSEEMPRHADLIERSHEAGICSHTESDSLAALYDDNRSVHYYRRGIPTKTKAESIVAAAAEFHRLATSSNIFDGSSCVCQ